jgi:hypothetical protein
VALGSWITALSQRRLRGKHIRRLCSGPGACLLEYLAAFRCFRRFPLHANGLRSSTNSKSGRLGRPNRSSP